MPLFSSSKNYTTLYDILEEYNIPTGVEGTRNRVIGAYGQDNSIAVGAPIADSIGDGNFIPNFNFYAPKQVTPSGASGGQSLQSYVDPSYYSEYQRHMGWVAANAPGSDRRSFEQWLRDGTGSNPSDPLWQDPSVATFLRGGSFVAPPPTPAADPGLATSSGDSSIPGQFGGAVQGSGQVTGGNVTAPIASGEDSVAQQVGAGSAIGGDVLDSLVISAPVSGPVIGGDVIESPIIAAPISGSAVVTSGDIIESPVFAPSAPVTAPVFLAPIEAPVFVAPVEAPVVAPVGDIIDSPVFVSPVSAPVVAPAGDIIESPVFIATSPIEAPVFVAPVEAPVVTAPISGNVSQGDSSPIINIGSTWFPSLSGFSDDHRENTRPRNKSSGWGGGGWSAPSAPSVAGTDTTNAPVSDTPVVESPVSPIIPITTVATGDADAASVGSGGVAVAGDVLSPVIAPSAPVIGPVTGGDVLGDIIAPVGPVLGSVVNGDVLAPIITAPVAEGGVSTPISASGDVEIGGDIITGNTGPVTVNDPAVAMAAINAANSSLSSSLEYANKALAIVAEARRDPGEKIVSDAQNTLFWAVAGLLATVAFS